MLTHHEMQQYVKFIAEYSSSLSPSRLSKHVEKLTDEANKKSETAKDKALDRACELLVENEVLRGSPKDVRDNLLYSVGRGR